MEKLVEIEEFPNYMVSNSGTIVNRTTGRTLKPKINRGGYSAVNLYNSNGMRTKIVHRLVADTYLDSELNHLQVNHIDGDKGHNSFDNLEYVTSKDNHNHAFATGLRDPRFAPKSVRCLETNEVFNSMADAAKKLGVSPGNISGVLRGKARHTGGYSFELCDAR